MKKLLLIVLGTAVLVSLILIFAFKSWLTKMNESMPPEGRAIFAQIDPEKCSKDQCAACTPEQCESLQTSCLVKEYRWTSSDKAYFRHYCDRAAATSK